MLVQTRARLSSLMMQHTLCCNVARKRAFRPSRSRKPRALTLELIVWTSVSAMHMTTVIGMSELPLPWTLRLQDTSDRNLSAYSVKYSTKSKVCELFQYGGLAPQPSKNGDNSDWLFFIDPPPQVVPMDVTHLCSTECPAAHNQKYVSEYGKVCLLLHRRIPFPFLFGCRITFFCEIGLPHGMRQAARNSAFQGGEDHHLPGLPWWMCQEPQVHQCRLVNSFGDVLLLDTLGSCAQEGLGI